jgi:hypothetical protein
VSKEVLRIRKKDKEKVGEPLRCHRKSGSRRYAWLGFRVTEKEGLGNRLGVTGKVVRGDTRGRFWVERYRVGFANGRVLLIVAVRSLLYATIRFYTLLYAATCWELLLYARVRYYTLLYAVIRYYTLLYAAICC